MKALTICIAAIALAGCQTVAREASLPSAHSPAADAQLRALAGQVREDTLSGFVAKMVSFGTRHTLSPDVNETRGVGAARRWVEAEFGKMSAACGGCIEVITPNDTVTNQRIPTPTRVTNVVAVMRGGSDPSRVIIIQGHLDSMPSSVMDPNSDAPGANDDASGVAAVMEAARILSKQKFPATLVFAALTGEEQGLVGGRILAKYAVDNGWKVEAVLNNDIVGNSRGLAATITDRVRVFSEGVRTNEPEAIRNARTVTGGEVDGPSRNLARYIHGIAERNLDGFSAKLVYRRDRFGRSGDQVPMLEAGFPAVRITEAAENYTRQHQNVRVENGISYGDVFEGVDFAYLANVTKMNLMAMAGLALAPPPPLEVKVEGAVSANVKLSWTAVPGADHYAVWKRDTLSPYWTEVTRVPATQTEHVFPATIIDDWFFGVSAVSADGHASPVQFAGVVGAFVAPAPK